MISAADMKVATTIFVGNISDKATDTLVRQILLVSSLKSCFDVILYMHVWFSVVYYVYSVNRPFLCNSCSDVAELKAGREFRMLLGSCKVWLSFYLGHTILGPRDRAVLVFSSMCN